MSLQAYGWCPNGSRCPMSHDTDLIIRQDEKSKEDKRKKRKRKRKKKKAAKEEGEEEDEEDDEMPQDKKPHTEDMNEDPEEEDKNVDGKHCAQDGELPSAETPAADPVKEGSDAPQRPDPTSDGKNRKVEAGTHRAGFDAFMTGYIFAFASLNADGSDSWIPECANKLYLSGKSVPLHIAKSSFSKSTKAHVTKMEQVWKGQFPKAEEIV